MPSRRGAAPIALVAWTLFVWTTRVGNIWNDASLSDAQKWGRTALALSFTALAGAAGVAVWRKLGWQRTAVVVLAAWTVVVWVTRSYGIAAGDHDGAFVAVHLVLAIVSWTLAGLAARPSAWSTPSR